ncbi:2'-5' RNA ligase family protein [Kineococcus aurantiacus]|uniref:2'-5' RNA ligase family protein n=1 Tax=Kineococcus aurantiacus TaxID=37633 RepID=UPI0031CE22A7
MPHLLALRPPEDLSDALRALGTFREVGPHITVKAQAGLDDLSRPQWLPRVQQALAGFGPFTVQLGVLGTFGEAVAFLEVTSPKVLELHEALMHAVAPPPQEAARFFELDGWQPHLTLRQGLDIDLPALRAAVDDLGPLPSFTVDEVWLCRQDAPDVAYVLDQAISLR